MNILITAIGSFSADCAISTLKAANHKVVGCDIYPPVWHYVSQKCDKVYQAPFATNEQEYIRFLLDTCQKEELDNILPLTDLEIDVLNRHRDTFAKAGIQLLMQETDCLRIARDKYAMYEKFINDPQVDVPTSCKGDALDYDFPTPAIAKPINGRSSEGLMKLTESQQLAAVMGKNNYIIQEMIPGSVFTVDYVRDSYGNDFAVPREELLRTKNGAGTTVRVVPEKALQTITSYIGQQLNVVGCVNMEFIANNGKYYLIDINPRFSAGIAFTHCAGFDLVTSHIKALNGQQICSPVVFKEQIVSKHYLESVLWTKED